MPRLYNPETQDVIDAHGTDVQTNVAAGYIVVGNRPEDRYLGRTRDEIMADDETPDDDGDDGPREDRPNGDKANRGNSGKDR